MDLWKQLVRAHLGRRLVSRVADIALDIQAVDVGLKPSFLFDYGAVSEAQLIALLQSARGEGLLKNHKLCVVRVDMDVLIVNPASLEQYLNLLDTTITFIDVSGHLGTPMLMLSDMIGVVQPSIAAVEKILSEIRSRGSFASFCAEIPPLGNVSTIYGLLLGYPVVYWYEQSEINDFGKCLSMEPLNNVKVCGERGQVGQSNTVPLSTMPTAPNKGDNLCKTTQHVNFSRTTPHHVVYSFSFPECFLTDLSAKIEDWFCCLHCSVTWKYIFKDVFCTQKVTAQAAVVL